MKNKAFVAILLSHLVVLLSLLAPIIHVSDARQSISGEKIAESEDYINIIEFVINDIHRVTTVLMLALAVFHLCGIVNAIVSLFKKSYTHKGTIMAFVYGFASALMGALNLYSGSYALFAICAASFLFISFWSIKLMKAEE